MWHQAQMDAEARGLPPPPQPSFSPTPPSAPSYNPSSIEHGLALDAQRPPYNPSLYELPSVPSSSSPSAPPASAPPPSYDRCTKPLPSATAPAAPSSAGSPAPTFDRSAKPQLSTTSSMRKVLVPQDLISTFLRIAKYLHLLQNLATMHCLFFRVNSDRGIETLGTLGGSLRNNRLVISHLVIPR